MSISPPDPLYTPGATHLYWCRRCAWVGTIDRSNAYRIHFEPQYDRCPKCGDLLVPPQRDERR